MALPRVNLEGGKSSLPSTIPSPFTNHYAVTGAKTITITTGWRCAFTADADIWIAAAGSVAAVPAGDVTNGTGSSPLIKGQTRIFEIESGATFSVIAATGTANVGVEIWGT